MKLNGFGNVSRTTMAGKEGTINRRRFVKTTLGALCVTALGDAAVLSIKKTKVVKRPVCDVWKLNDNKKQAGRNTQGF